MCCAVLCHSVMSNSFCSPPSYSVHGILQARMLEWVAIPFSRGSSWPRHRNRVACIAGRFFTVWATQTYLKDTFIQGGISPPKERSMWVDIILRKGHSISGMCVVLEGRKKKEALSPSIYFCKKREKYFGVILTLNALSTKELCKQIAR